METLRVPQSGVRLGRRAGATLAVSAWGVALGVAANLALARALGTRGYGGYSWALVIVFGLAVPAAVGLDVLLMRDAAVLADRNQLPMVRGMWRLAQRVALSGGTALAVVAALSAAAAQGALPHGLLVPLLVGLPALPLVALGLLQQGLTQGLHRPVAGLLAWSVLRQAVLLASVVIALAAGSVAPAGAMVLAVLASAITAAAGTCTVRRLLGPGPATRPAPGWTRQARPMALGNCITVLDAQLGIIALGLLDGPRAAGLFAAATQATVGFVLLRNAGFRPLAPLMANLHHAGDRVRLQAALTRATRGVAAVTLAAAILLVALADPVLSLFGSGFRAASNALVLLAIAHVVNAFVAFNGTALNVTGHQARVARSATIGLLLNGGLLLLLIPLVGVDGAAIAALADVTVRNALNSRAARCELGLETAALIVRRRARHREASSLATRT